MSKLIDFINENNLVLPNYNDVNSLDVIKCLYKRCGAPIEDTKNIKEIDKIIPKNKHYLFILSDGTGSNLISKLRDSSVLKKNLKRNLTTVFPSTTGCVLTSIATATYPEEHGIWGWYSYNKKLNRDFMPLIFSDRSSMKALSEFNIKPKDVYIKGSMLKKLKVNASAIYPKFMVDSEYSKFTANTRFGYDNYDEVLDIIKEINKNNDSSYTYLYLPFVDSVEHKNGVDDEETMKTLLEVEELVEKISKIKDITIVFTADHGQYNVDEDIIMDFAKYKKYFYAYPTIDYGTASYYVKKEFKKEFVKEFKKDFKDKLFLFNKKEFFKNNLFGTGNVKKRAKDNLGEYISLCKNGSYLINTEDIGKYYGQIKGNHSGLMKDEMIVPLIVINTNNTKCL